MHEWGTHSMTLDLGVNPSVSFPQQMHQMSNLISLIN